MSRENNKQPAHQTNPSPAPPTMNPRLANALLTLLANTETRPTSEIDEPSHTDVIAS